MELIVYNINGEKTTKKVNLPDSIFNVEPNENAIYLDVKQNMACKRQGTHSSKERSALSGSTRKIKRQKGTGTARAGDIKSPLFRGGARAFGPAPRDYSFKLNKKLKSIARKSALTSKAKDNEIIVVEDFSFETAKTKSFVSLLNNLKIDDKKTLFVFNEANKNVYLSSRNLQKVKTISVTSLNTYDVLNSNVLLILESSLAKIEKLYA